MRFESLTFRKHSRANVSEIFKIAVFESNNIKLIYLLNQKTIVKFYVSMIDIQ